MSRITMFTATALAIGLATSATRFTRITRGGHRVAIGDLAVGDRAFVRGVTRHGVTWAVRVDALS